MSYLIKNKKHFILLAAFFAFAGFLFFPGGIARAFVTEIVINNLLRAVRELVAMFLSMSTTLFVWIINVDNFNQIIANNGALYPIWQKVRDILNIAFILVLLFSAFSTIFQVEKYNYKKILLNLVIMALLVNFSFPITRFIIDASNVMMYTFVNNLLGNDAAGNALTKISDSSGMSFILSSESGDGGKTSYILAQIIFGFILAITLLAVGILLVIRMMALALIIIFSPIAFVGSILPDTSGKASQWWTYLFQYSFFGPVMIFVIYIATQFMQKNEEFQKAFTSLATQESIDSGMIGNMAMFSLPIVLLWMGMGVAQSMSIAGASTVMGGAQKFAKWVGKGTYKAPYWAIKKTGVHGGVSHAWDDWKKRGILGSAAVAKREAGIAARLGVKGAAETDMKKRAEEYKKNNESDSSLKAKCAAGDAAACYRLAEDKNLDDATYKNFNSKNKNAGIKKALDIKVKQNRTDIVAIGKATDHNSEEFTKIKTANPTWSDDAVEYQVMEDEMGKLTAEKLADQNWADIDKSLPPGPVRNKMMAALVDAYTNLQPAAKTELSKRISPSNGKALRNLGVPI